MFVWERPGVVWVVENGQKKLFIDISEEVGGWRDFGLLGFALHPQFDTNGYFYLLYTVDRHHLMHHGTSRYSATTNEYFNATIGRLTRYTASKSASGYTINNGSRKVLIGATRSTGIPVLHQSHGVGSLVFGTDGTLLVSAGDGASYVTDDVGSATETYYVQALADGIISNQQNVGAFRSQQLESYNGKILRIDPETGNGISSNPYYESANPASVRSKVWALGLRNPFRMTLRPNSGSTNPADARPGVLYVGDVGYGTWEDLNVVTRPGMNFGWPLFEGLTAHNGYTTKKTYNYYAPNPQYGSGGCTQQYFYFQDLIKQETASGTASFTNPCNTSLAIPASVRTFLHSRPVIDWRHGSSGPSRTGTFSGETATEVNIGASGSPVSGPQFGGNAAVAGVFYTRNDFPREFRNTLFFGDYSGRWIRSLTSDGNDKPTAVRDFISSGAIVVSMATHPSEGGIYYVSFPSEIRKVTYKNRTPIAVATSDKTYGNSPLTVQFNGSGSYDPDGQSISYLWDFGDGTTSTQVNPSHTFTAATTAPTTFNVTLTVSDPPGTTDQTAFAISVNNTPPQVTITSPADGTKYPMTSETSYTLKASVTDQEHSGSQLTYRWQTILHHEDHQHPEPSVSTPEPTISVSPLGCGVETYYYRIVLTVTDAAGLSTTKEVKLVPDCNMSTTPIVREVWENISGTAVSAIPVTTAPNSMSQLSLFEAPSNAGDNFGARVRAYVQAPTTGDYTFWIASDQDSELWLSTDENPSNKRKIASVSGLTNSREWTKYASQTSALISLQAGRKYYIEALHKESTGSDNLAVGWRLPDGGLERPIPGYRLTPYTTSGTNLPPVANAGPDKAIELPANSVQLSGSGTISSYSWSQVSGPNTATFSSRTVAAPTVSGLLEGSYVFRLTVTDNGGASASDEAAVTVHPAPATGTPIVREFWANVTGMTVADIPVNTTPTSTSQLTSFEAPSYQGDNYGARVRAYVHAPATGSYTFWIASDDHSELWLSADENPANKRRIAYVEGHTSSRQWTRYASQTSGTITLQAGRKYYIEALHKEATGGDNLAVGWQLPDGTLERPIPGNRLSAYSPSTTNVAPTANAGPDKAVTLPANSVTLSGSGTDSDGTISTYSWSKVSGPSASLSGASSATLTASNLLEGSYVFRLTVTDNAGASASDDASVTVHPAPTSTTHIMREVWENVSGKTVSTIPVTTAPSSTSQLTLFEAPSNVGDNYGARIRAYVHAPATGSYTFWIASDDHSELWLSTDENPANKRRIAYVEGYTSSRQWTRYASQTSGTITLQAGRKYYIEALHKEATGGDNLAVGWQLPDGTLERPIPGYRLTPYTTSGTNLPPVANAGPDKAIELPANSVQLSGSGTDSDGTISSYSWSQVSGPNTATFSSRTVAAPTVSGLLEGSYVFRLTVTDNGGASASDEAAVTVHPAPATGTPIVREFWANVTGMTVAEIPVNTTPTSTSQLTLFESPKYTGDNYGVRVRAYVHAPATGSYTFWIASDDHSELWLSTDESPANKRRIAYLESHTNSREWTRFPSQKSAAISLQAGRKYYIEALHKEHTGSDHLAVGWQLPDGTQERPIPGNRLSPYNLSQTATAQVIAAGELITDPLISYYPNPFEYELTLQLNGRKEDKYSLQLFDMLGREVWQLESVEADQKLVIGKELAAGVYVLIVRAGKEAKQYKVVKARKGS
ncbi:hypothetical protein GCM10027443_07050 [Pontibacter brevis]